MPANLEKWVEDKLKIATLLEEGAAGAGYAEACLVISAILSGIASDLWPGRDLDRKRFVELWTRYAPEELGASLVSTPSLIKDLEDKGKYEEATVLRNTNREAFGPGFEARVVTSDFVDMPVKEVLRMCPNLHLKQVRKHTYGSLFYERIRSAYVHEYRIGHQATAYPMGRSGVGVSYANTWRDVTPESHGDSVIGWAEIYREIHFEVNWLCQLVRGVVRNVAADWGKPLPEPEHWWISG